MEDRITIEGRDGAFSAYIARPKALPASQTRGSTAIRVSITPSRGTMGRTTMPRQQRSPMDGQVNFYINNCGDLRSPLMGTVVLAHNM